MTNLIATDAAKQELDSLLYFYEIEASSSTTLRYHPGLNASSSNLGWYSYSSPYSSVTYTALPISMDGETRQAMGSESRPTLNIGTIATTFSSDLAGANIYAYDDLVGKKITRRTTLAKYINGGSADTGSGSAPVEFPKMTYLIENIIKMDNTSVVFELASPFDTQGITIPHRRATANLCSWIYKGVNLANVGGEYSACYWSDTGQWKLDGYTHSVYFNELDEPIVPSSTSFTSYTSGAVTKNSFYSTSSTETRIGTDGSSSSQSISNYWQAVADNNTPGTPSDSNTAFRRVRVYSTYSSSATYYTYQDTQHNDYVINSNKVWKVTSSISGEEPGFNAYWTPGDVCGKKLNSCASRFAFKPISSGSSNQLPSVDKDTTKILPFGGFPGLARKYLR